MRHFVPELKDYPVKYIYEPWKAPIQDQRKAGCIIKGDGTEPSINSVKTYPKPIFDFPERRAVCIEGIKKAYSVNLYGNDPKVLDGTWRKFFSDTGEGPTEGTNGADAATGNLTIRKDVDVEKEDQGVDEAEGGAADVGGDNKGGYKEGNKRTRGKENGTLDAFVSARKLRKTR